MVYVIGVSPFDSERYMPIEQFFLKSLQIEPFFLKEGIYSFDCQTPWDCLLSEFLGHWASDGEVCFFLSCVILKIFNILKVLRLPDPGSILERERPLLRLWVQSTAAFGSSKAPGSRNSAHLPCPR